MEYIIAIGAGLFFLLHIISETISSFVKYNFASLGRHMQGISIANMFAIASRGFVAIFGLLAAYIVESGVSAGWIYGVALSASLLIGAVISFLFSRVRLVVSNSEKIFGMDWGLLLCGNEGEGEDFKGAIVKINGALSLLLGIQFVAIVVAYGICFRFPDYRLLIISLVPLISMIGTLATVVLVEPRLAKIVDSSLSAGYAASREFMRARAVSFLFSCFVLLVLTIFSKA